MNVFCHNVVFVPLTEKWAVEIIGTEVHDCTSVKYWITAFTWIYGPLGAHFWFWGLWKEKAYDNTS